MSERTTRVDQALFDESETHILSVSTERLFDVREFFEEHPQIEMTAEFAELAALFHMVALAQKARLTRLRFARSRVPAARAERILGDARIIQPWILAKTIDAEISGSQDALCGGGHLNMFWIPELVVVSEELDGKWHCDAPERTPFLERFDQIFGQAKE